MAPAPGETVSAQRYLADTAGAGDAVEAYIEAMAGLGERPTRAQLSAAAPDLRSAADRVSAFSARLGSVRLDDSRLDEQREGVAVALEEVVLQMERLARAAEAGRPLAAAIAAEDLAAALSALRTGADPS